MCITPYYILHHSSLQDKYVRFQKAVKSLNGEMEIQGGLITFALSAQLKIQTLLHDAEKYCPTIKQ